LAPNNFVGVRLETCCLQALDEFGVHALTFMPIIRRCPD